MFPSRNKWRIFLVVAAGVFMSTLDSSMVNIALPAIMDHYHSPLRITEWVVMIYLLTVTATILFWGHLSDRLGRRRVYSSGMFIFAAGSLSCYYSPFLPWLIVSRFVQALGAAMMMSTGPAIIRETFPPEQLGRGLGLIGMAVSLGLMTGPSLGGLLIELLSWRSIFLITVPVGFFFFYLARLYLPATSNSFEGKPVDWGGGLIWALALTFLSLALNYATSPDWSGLVISAALALAGASFVIFFRLELKARQPLLPLTLFGQKFFSAGLLCAVISFMVLFTAIMLTPFYLDRILGLSPSRIGLIMMAIPVTVMAVAPIAGWLFDYFGARYIATIGLAISSSGLLLMAFLPAGAKPLDIAARLTILGFGQALFLAPNSASILGRVTPELTGTSAALLATGRNLGMLLGLAQAGVVFSFCFGRLTGGLDMRDFAPVHMHAFMVAVKCACIAGSAIGFAGAIISWLRGGSSS